MATISKKICLIGDFGVGKTSLIRQFVERQFSDQYLSTIGVKISRKTLQLSNVQLQAKLDLQLLIWDIEGRTKFKAIAPTYLQGARGALIVADMTRTETLVTLTDHIQLFSSVNPQGCMVVAFNKSDLVDKETLAKILQTYKPQEGEKILATYATSAKTGETVDRIFETLSYGMVRST